MSAGVYEKIRNDPVFVEAMAKRRRFAWTLAIIVLVMFYSFILVVAFAPQVLHTPLAAGTTTSIGIPIGVGLIVFFWLLTGYYVRRANREFEAVNAEIIERATR